MTEIAPSHVARQLSSDTEMAVGSIFAVGLSWVGRSFWFFKICSVDGIPGLRSSASNSLSGIDAGFYHSEDWLRVMP
jgi:hypothetical protein